MLSSGMFIPLPCLCLSAGVFEILSGSVNALKQSARFAFSVTDGSKVILVFSFRAILLLVFLHSVSERLSLCVRMVGFNLGTSFSRRRCASIAHFWGFVQPPALSSLQSSQWHEKTGVCTPPLYILQKVKMGPKGWADSLAGQGDKMGPRIGFDERIGTIQ